MIDASVIGLSVTQRIKTISQPRNGYIRNSDFATTYYEDSMCIEEIKSPDKGLLSIQGLAVDYLVRYMLTGDKKKSFSIPYMGAIKLDEANGNDSQCERYNVLLSAVNGLDEVSIYNACKIVGYDTAFRAGIQTFRDVNEINPPQEMIHNISIMVRRGLVFLDKIGPVCDNEMTFEGGYTNMVSSGDGDYLTDRYLVDFKVSKEKISPKWSLQLLMYYLLGIHSIHKAKYSKLQYLCIFNCYENVSYTIALSDISNETKYNVSHDVIGYKMKYKDLSKWRYTDGSDLEVCKEFIERRIKETKANISSYEDGIHEITVEDYWSILRKLDKEYRYSIRPNFKNTDHVLMIKKKKYVMFLSVSCNGTYGVLLGGKYRKASYAPEYYYDRIDTYAEAVNRKFSKYWDALKSISKQIKNLRPSEDYLHQRYEEYVEHAHEWNYKPMLYDRWYQSYGRSIKLDGKIHGCIVDIDYMNHIFLNPLDGKIVPYYATSMANKDVFVNVKSLIAKKRPEMLESVNQLIDIYSLMPVGDSSKNTYLVSKSDKISKKTVKVYSTEMYSISNRLKPLQKVYEHNLIQVWYDDILNENKRLLEDKYKIKNKSTRTFGSTGSPQKARERYVGLTEKMNCGLKATIIEYRNYNDVTVQFEDGTIRDGIRIDKFLIGKVACVRNDQRYRNK